MKPVSQLTFGSAVTQESADGIMDGRSSQSVSTERMAMTEAEKRQLVEDFQTLKKEPREGKGQAQSGHVSVPQKSTKATKY